MRPYLRIFLAATGLATALTVALARPALADLPEPSERPVLVRTVNAATNVDGLVVRDGDREIADLRFGEVSPHIPIAATTRSLQIDTGMGLTDHDIMLDAGTSATLLVTSGLGGYELDVRVLPEPTPQVGTGSAVRYVQAAASLVEGDVSIDGVSVGAVPHLSTSTYVPVEPGRHEVTVALNGEVVRRVTYTSAPGEVWSIYAIGGGERIVELHPFLDARAVAQVPVGPVLTGPEDLPDTSAGKKPIPWVFAAVALSTVLLLRRWSLVLALMLLVSCASDGSDSVSNAAENASATATSSLSTAPPVGEPPGSVPSLSSQLSGIAIPAIGASTTNIVDLDVLSDGTLATPENAEAVGWFRGSVVPGLPGPSILAGHVRYGAQLGTFGRLSELRPGDLIELSYDNGTSTRWTVTASQSYAKSDFPSDVVFGPSPIPELRLITCGREGPALEGSNPFNVVIYATLEGTS